MALSEQEILSGLAEIVNEETGLEPDEVQMDKSFTDDLDIDSLSMMTIVVNAEDKFGVRIPDDEVKNLTHVKDAVSYIANNRADPPAGGACRPDPPAARPLADAPAAADAPGRAHGIPCTPRAGGAPAADTHRHPRRPHRRRRPSWRPSRCPSARPTSPAASS